MFHSSPTPAGRGVTTRSRGYLTAVLSALLLTSTIVTALLSGAASASASGGCAMRAQAYATSARLGTLIRSGPSANTGLAPVVSV